MNFLQDEAGATSIEYALIASLISISIIAMAYTLGNAIQQTYVSIETSLSNASGS